MLFFIFILYYFIYFIFKMYYFILSLSVTDAILAIAEAPTFKCTMCCSGSWNIPEIFMGITEAVQGSQGPAQTGPGPSGGPTSQCSGHALKVAAITCGCTRGPKRMWVPFEGFSMPREPRPLENSLSYFQPWDSLNPVTTSRFGLPLNFPAWESIDFNDGSTWGLERKLKEQEQTLDWHKSMELFDIQQKSDTKPSLLSHRCVTEIEPKW